MKTLLKRDKVILVQEIANNCWPAKEYFFLNGWILRFTDGATSRANSVLLLYYFGSHLEEDISLVEKTYQIHNLPTKFMLHDYYAPSELKSKLMTLNYQIDPIVDIMGNKIDNLHQISSSKEYNYINYTDKPKEWSEAFIRLETNRSFEEKRGILGIMDRIIFPKKEYFAATTGNRIVGIVLGVVERHYLGIMDLIVDPNYRRQGIATSLLNMVVEWARECGCNHIFLQVVRENHSAVSLYRKMNFKRLYSYFYMTKE
ncbi:MAG: GNAT family N-acetyltransferase [Candidatus Heimdallarchaeota archaeon]|nr:MAG: GNAT family N-acetyltransferase [Candidatus Heimdallarchaeota archaeon]